MSMIQLENVGKRYWLQHQSGERRLMELLQDKLTTAVRTLSGQGSAPSRNREEFWALRDISLQINEGEVVGLIGRNGAGKSTLLKLISWIMAPTTGRVGVRGRLGCLLEVGSGFHPELTGRENIFLNGAILGMSLQEIRRKFDRIVEFSEVEAFLDTPVKHFSSGMFVRLAFAVAAFLDPEVLIVDEVLAVGDAAFQQKCLNVIRESVDRGCTCIFVSHHLPSITSLCRRAILLQGGRLVADGAPDDVVRTYLASARLSAGEQTWDEATAPGNDQLRLRKLVIWQTAPDQPTGDVELQHDVFLRISYQLLQPVEGVTTTLWLKDSGGMTVFMSSSAEQMLQPGWQSTGPALPGEYQAECRIPAQLLNEGRYSVSIFVGRGISHHVAVAEDTLAFQTHDTGALRAITVGAWPGVVRPHLEWTTGPAV